MDSSATQLGVVGYISDLLSKSRIAHWLFGGWAVDFAIGRITRPHDDIEFMIRQEDGGRVDDLLAEAGFTQLALRGEDTIWEVEGQKVELYFLTRDAAGRVVVAGQWDGWPFAEDAFGSDRGKIGGVSVPTASPRALLEAKLRYRSYTGKPSRQKDQADIRLLEQVVRDGREA